MTPRERNIANSYSRSELLETLCLAFDTTNIRSVVNGNRKETFFDSTHKESFDFTFDYFYYIEPLHIREIYITTWEGGWGHLQRSLNLEYSVLGSGWDIKREFRNDTTHNLILEGLPKTEIIPQIINYFQLIDYDKIKPLVRHYNLNQLI